MADPDRDVRVSERYRALGREQPPPELDAAILAASRRRHARWVVPVSIAAVVVLAVGVTLRVQIEERKDAEDIALSPRVMQAPASPPAALESRAQAAPEAAAPQLGARKREAPAEASADRAEPAGRASAGVAAGKLSSAAADAGAMAGAHRQAARRGQGARSRREPRRVQAPLPRLPDPRGDARARGAALGQSWRIGGIIRPCDPCGSPRRRRSSTRSSRSSRATRCASTGST
jgi:hypothetical protein